MAIQHSQLSGSALHNPKGIQAENSSTILYFSQSIAAITASGDLVPDQIALRNLGSSTRPWKELFVSTGSIVFVDNEGNVIQTLSADETGISLGEGGLTGSGLLVNGNGNVTGDFTVQGVFTAQEFKTELVSSSIIFESGSTLFGNSYDDTHTFTGSVKVDGGLTGSLLGTASTSSYVDYFNIDNRPTLLSGSEQISSQISGAFTEASSSFSTRITQNESDISSLTTDSGSFSSRVTDLESFSSSLDNTYATDQELSSTSSSLATDIASNLQFISDLQTDSGSFSIRVSSNESDIANLQTDSGSLSNRVTDLESFSSSLDNTFASDQELSEVSSSILNTLESNYLKNTTDTLTGDLTVTGTIVAQQFNTEYVTSSIIFESGSTKFGDTLDDKHEFTGSLEVEGGITGSLLGTSSFVDFSNVGNKPTLLSSSAQIASDISGSFTALSQSVETDFFTTFDLINNLETELGEIETGVRTVASASNAITASFALNAAGAGFPFSGSGVITGSLLVSGGLADFSKSTGVTGSFTGDGSGLTGIVSSSVSDIAGILSQPQTITLFTASADRNTVLFTDIDISGTFSIPTGATVKFIDADALALTSSLVDNATNAVTASYAVGYISTATLKSLVAASPTYNDFSASIAAL